MAEEKHNEQSDLLEPEDDPKYQDLLSKYKELQQKVNQALEKPTFVTMQTKNKAGSQPATNLKTEKKQNEAPNLDFEFNGYEVFFPQMQSVKKLNALNPNATILTMRLHPDPRYPEWVV